MPASHPLWLWRPAPRALWILLAGYLALALAYSLAFPPFEPSDEIDHFRYVRYLIEQRRLPVFEADNLSEYHQPPLYYALSAALSWPFPADDLPDYFGRVNPYRGFRYAEPGLDNKNLYVHGPWDRWPFHDTSLSLHVARLVSLIAGAVTVLLTYQTARAAYPRALSGQRTALVAAGLVAFNPMFLAVTGSLQNDAGAAAGGAVILWLGVSFYQAGFTPRRSLALGLAIGLGALLKITVAFLLLPAALLVLAGFTFHVSRFTFHASRLALLATGAALGGGWWYLRNLIIYGDPTVVSTNLDAYGGQTLAQGVAIWGQSLPYAWTTFWGRFGHGDLVLPGWIYLTLAAISLLALIGLALAFFKLDRVSSRRSARISFMFLGAAGLVEFAGLMTYLTLSPTGAYGRYTFPALPAYMILFALGLLTLVPRPARRWVSLALPAAMAAFAALTLGTYILPAYNPPPTLSGLPPDARPLQATLGDVAALRGYQVSATQARPGDRLFLTLYWEPLRRTELPYSVFIHLLDSEDVLVAQRDTYPGLGSNPTHGWTPGQLFADRYLVVIPETTYAPATARWEAGLWQADSGERAFVLGPVPNPVDLNFGGELRLKGYTLPTRTLTPGQPFDLTVYWQQTAEFSHPYAFFVHVVADDGRIWANNSFEVMEGEQTVQPVLAPDTPPGSYSLLFGVFYDTGQGPGRVKILADDGREINDHVRLTGVRVVGSR